MKIVETNLIFTSTTMLGRPDKITLHHIAASKGGAVEVHAWHLNRGWSGCGYHFVIRKDGTIERGRPENMLGAHVSNHNKGNLGISFEGDFEREHMTSAQIESGKWLIEHLRNKYGISRGSVYKHKDLGNTSCPGRNFQFEACVNGTATPVEPSKPSVDTSVYDKAKKYNARNLYELQRLLKARGFYKGSVDSIYGPLTHEAVGTAQSYYSLTVDYLAGPMTFAKLYQLVKRGSLNADVTALQKLLLSLGYDLGRGGADGDFGKMTYDAVVKLQGKYGLSVDGIVGYNTWYKIISITF